MARDQGKVSVHDRLGPLREKEEYYFDQEVDEELQKDADGK